MADRILVTGGTGTLGRNVVRQLVEGGRQVRLLSRRHRPGDAASPADWSTGDLVAGEGIAEAVAGVDTVVHCASGRSGDREAARNLLDGARRAGVSHLVYISIVGVDRVPFQSAPTW